MKSNRLALFSLVLGVLLVVFPFAAFAQEVEVDGPTFQDLLDQLFGTETTPGLLEGGQHFQLHAEDVTLTPEEFALFFTPSEDNSADFADLIAAAKQIKGAELKIEGILEGGGPFEFRLSGKQVKAEGLVLTQEEFDALVAELQGIDGLHEAKIEATVDGRVLIAKLENRAGRVKIEDRELRENEEGGRAGLDRDRRGREDREVEHGRVDRPERLEKIERVEKVERIERPERVERFERPEIEHGGPGRR